MASREAEERLLREVDRLDQHMVNHIQGLVRIPSENPPGDESEVAGYVAEALASLGVDVEHVEPEPGRVNTLGTLRGSGGGAGLLWNGHVDTVPLGNPDNWTVDPLGGEIRDGRVWGRGSGDMKGAVAAAITAVKALQDAGISLRGDLHIHAVADEELFGRSGTKYLCENGYIRGVDAAIVGESSTRDGRIMARPAVRGRTLVRLRARGRSAHSSRPHLGVNAVLKMSKALLAIEGARFRVPRHGLLPDPTIAPGTTIRGGTKDNTIPEECEALGDVRTVPGMSPGGGSNDPSSLTAVAGVPAMAFGPGGGNAHAPDEWADIRTHLNFAKIYGLMAMSLCEIGRASCRERV